MAPASDAPVKAVKVYGQCCPSLIFNAPALAHWVGQVEEMAREGGTNTERDS